MPNYDYECSSCHHEWEAFNTIVERNDEKCPRCHKRADIVISGTALELFEERWFPDMDKEPLHFSSKRKLMDACRQRGIMLERYM